MGLNPVSVRWKTNLALLGLFLLFAPTVYAQEKTQKATLLVEGMQCPRCEPKAVDALKNVPGVIQAKVSYKERTAVISYDPLKVKVDELVAALEKVGFTASPAQAKYICPTCQATYQAAGACLICEATLQPVPPEKKE